MKYVMFKCTTPEGIVQHVPIVFPAMMVHKMVAGQIASLLRNKHGFAKVQVVSAGDILLGEVTCSGDSETLKLSSNGRVDEAIIDAYPYFHGMEG